MLINLNLNYKYFFNGANIILFFVPLVINWEKVLLILLNTLSLYPDNQDIIT